MAYYHRKDVEGGVLTIEADINYYKRIQYVEVMNNLLLGDFNEQGDYVTSELIVNELVKLKKVKTYVYGNTTFCQSVSNLSGFGRLEFALKFTTDTATNTCIAHLELLEKIDKINGYFSNTNTVLIATYKSKKMTTFAYDAYNAFNLVATQDDSKIEDDFEPEAILQRKRYLLWLKSQLQPQLARFEKDLLEKRLKLLKKYPELEPVLKQYYAELKLLKDSYIKEQSSSFYRTANDLLDRVLQLHSELSKSLSQFNEELRQIQLEWVNKTGEFIIQFSNKHEQINVESFKESYTTLSRTMAPNVSQHQPAAPNKEAEKGSQFKSGSYPERRRQSGPYTPYPTSTTTSTVAEVDVDKYNPELPAEVLSGIDSIVADELSLVDAVDSDTLEIERINEMLEGFEL